MTKFLQINLNHCCEAQSLLLHETMVNHIGVAIVSEQYRDMDSPNGIGDAKGRAAIWWNSELLPSSCVACHRGDGYVIAKIDELVIASIYSSPNSDLENILEEITEHISQLQYKNIIIAGDFNARSVRWEDRLTNERGEILEFWADQLDLRLANEGGGGGGGAPHMFSPPRQFHSRPYLVFIRLGRQDPKLEGIARRRELLGS